MQSIGKKSDRDIESKKLRWTSSFTCQALAVWKLSGSGMVQPLDKNVESSCDFDWGNEVNFKMRCTGPLIAALCVFSHP
ncbi:hypothetical protein OBV_08790 [Oscillibacter valericigenes Sjm18-20]|nr:hypothetical protein OBV_08790 [Oscillibacter valericigenes Sjm18-20]